MRLLGVLLAIGIALGLTMFVADRVRDDPTVGAGGGTTSAIEPGDVGGEPSLPALSLAQSSACAAQRQVLEAAEEARFVLRGEYADAATLVAEQLLREEPTIMTVTPAPDRASYTISECRFPAP